MNNKTLLMEELARELSKSIDTPMLRGVDDLKTLSDSKAVVDPTYLHSIKRKVEKILREIIDKYELHDYLSDNYRCRVDPGKMVDSKYYKLYMECKDIDGKKLKYGHEHVPEDFEDWKAIYLTDYVTAEVIYNEMCRTKRIQKEDLIILNSLAKKYKVLPE